MIVDAPDAKLTPVRNWDWFFLRTRDRYGGEVGKPTLSAVQNSSHLTKYLFNYLCKT